MTGELLDDLLLLVADARRAVRCLEDRLEEEEDAVDYKIAFGVEMARSGLLEVKDRVDTLLELAALS